MATVCEHCHSPVGSDEDGVFREGHSYHSECHKCYVCSNPDVDEAEIFKGVIFCTSCSRRIFQEYSVISRVKGRSLTRQNPRLVDVLFTRNSLGLAMGEREVIERVRIPNNLKRNMLLDEILKKMSGSDLTSRRSLNSMKSKKIVSDKVLSFSKLKKPQQKELVEEFIKYDADINKPSKTVRSDENIGPLSSKGMIKHYENEIINVYSIKSLENAESKSVKINKDSQNAIRPPEGVLNVASNKKIQEKDEKKSIKRSIVKKMNKNLAKTDRECSDLRMAELGTSLEMASMALRNKSNESSYDIKGSLSTVSSKNPFSTSIVEMYSASAGSNSIQETNRGILDKRLRSLLKIPFTSFKKKIWDCSSLVKMLVDNPELEEPYLRRLLCRLRTAPSCVQAALAKPKYKLKNRCRRETIQHQGRGLRKLYTTIHRKDKPGKLGWPSLEPKVYCFKKSGDCRTHPVRCKHFDRSHSYRCMRRQAMRLAGPTQEKLTRCRNNIVELLLPKIFRQLLSFSKRRPGLQRSPLPLGISPTFRKYSGIPLYPYIRNREPNSYWRLSGYEKNTLPNMKESGPFGKVDRLYPKDFKYRYSTQDDSI